MTRNEALEVLKYYQEWRLGGEGEQPHPKNITKAIDVAIEIMSRKQPSTSIIGDVKAYSPWGK